MVDPIDYTRGNGFGQGLQLAGLYQDVQQRRAQAEQAQAQQEALNAFQADWQASFGDPQKMAALVAKYPGQMDAIKAGIGFQDEQHQMALGNAARDLRVAMATGNPQAVQQAALNHANVLGSVGSSPEEIVQQFQQDPNSLAHIVDAVGLNALGAKDYYGVTGDREKLAETIRSNQASEALQGQQIAVSRENSIRAAYAPTAAMQNYSQYAQMLKADPDAAAAFASSAGINTSAKKLMKVEKNDDGSVTKYYTDGSEEAGKLLQPITAEGIRPISLPQAQTILDKANEGTKKSAGFALRLKDSMDSMNQLSKTIDPKRVALINKSLGDGTIANMSLSPAEQQYMVNARDGLYAILRPETGAAITLPEMQEYSKMYLPQPGDSKEATETKMRKMRGQYNALRGQAGRAYDALVVSSAANTAQQDGAEQASAAGTHTSKSGIKFTVK